MIFWCIYIRSVTFHAVYSVKKQKDNYYAKYMYYRGRRSQRIFFRSFGPQFGLKIKGEGGPQAPSLDPPLLCKDGHFQLTRK